MPEVAENIIRFRNNLKQFISLKEAGKLNGKATTIEEKLKGSAEMVGLDFEEELSQLDFKNPPRNIRANPSLHVIKVDTSKIKGSTYSELRKSAQEYAKKHIDESEILNEDQKEKIILRWRGIKRTINKPAPKIRLYTIPYIPELIKKGILISVETDKRNRADIRRVLKFNAIAVIDGAEYSVQLVVRETKEGKLYYEHTLLEKEKPAGTSGRKSQKEKLPNRPSTGSQKNTKKSEQRENPVELPFAITLKGIDKLHSIRSVKKLNSYVGHKHPCYITKHSGEKPDSHISFKYDPDYRNKKYTLDLLLDGKLEFTACAEGSDKNFTTTWKQVLAEYGDLTVEIRSQDHAKKVLGAEEYRKQEKEQSKKETTEAEKEKLKVGDFVITKTGRRGEITDIKEVDFTEINQTSHLGQQKGYLIEGNGIYFSRSQIIKKIDEPDKLKSEKPEGKVKEYKPTFSQLATYLAFSRMKEYDYGERFTSRIEDYQKKIYLDSDKSILIFESWHNREYDEDHTRWHSISRGGKYDTLYNSDHPDVEALKPITVQEKIPAKKKSENPSYKINQDPRDGKRVKINRSVLLREIILGKMEAAMYKSFDGMIDSTNYVKKADIEWFDPSEDGFFWSRNFREFQSSSYDHPSHYDPNEITLGDYKYRYKEYVEKSEEESSKKPKAENLSLIQGHETTIDFKADGSISEPGYFALVDVKDIVASHNKDCTVNSDHEISKAQPRDRSVEALCAQPKFIAKNLNPSSITQGNLAFNGTPVTTVMLQAVQGNGRSIALKIAYDELPKKAAEYKKYLEKNASKFGFKKAQVKAFSQPVLIRVLDVSESRAVELGNVVDTSQAKMNKIDAAKAYVRNLPEEKRKVIGDIINDSNGETLGEVIDDKGLKIFDQFKDLDRSDLVANNALTSEGKDFLRSVFAGLVFDSEDRKGSLQAFLSLPHQIKAGLERSYGHLIPFVGSKADITPEVRGSVMIVDALTKREGIETVDELFKSVDAFEGSFADKFSIREKALAKLLVNTSAQKEIRNAFRMYQYFITGKEDLFNPIKKTTPEIAFRLAFIEKHRMNPVWSNKTANKVGSLDKEFYELVEEKGLNPYSKEAGDLWKEAGFQDRFKQVTKSGRIHDLKVRIQRLQSLGNDNSKEIAQLNKLVGKDNWAWNNEQTQIEFKQARENPRTVKFIFLGVLDKLFIDQGKKSHVELQGPHSMLTNKAKNKIFIVPFSLIRSFDGTINDKKAEEIFEEWNNYEVDENDMTISWPDEAKSEPVGTAKSIFYISDKVLKKGDKKGKMNIYHHEFDEGKRPAVKKGNILIVSNLEIDERGILN